MTWLPSPEELETEAARKKAEFVAIDGEELRNEIQAMSAPKPLAQREVMRQRRPSTNDRPALQTEDSDDPNWWDR